MLSDINKKLFTLHKLKGVGPATLRNLIAHADFQTASIEELAERTPKLKNALKGSGAWSASVELMEEDLDAVVRAGARIISVLDADYPPLLRATPDGPFFLYIKGSWSADVSKSIAIIGTRQPTDHGSIITRRITAYLTEAGWSIVSGLALGCDAIAHQVALECNGHTVAVLAHGLHTTAPKQHQKLSDEILEKGGALVTEYAFGVDPIPPHFVKRDRIQAGLSRAVTMVQSDLNGGSLHASRAAIEYRRWLVVPAPTERDVSSGEKKVEANSILVGDSVEKKLSLLKCQRQDLSRLVSLQSKEDYPSFLRLLEQPCPV